jgi:NAD(P)-dependent dehydrogenase (short-subunit alcohol dehydrogenase family)
MQCDLANADEFGRLLDEIYSSHGAIHGVIHGAGVIEDRLVEDKDPRSFDRVLGAKVTGAMVLAQRLRPDMLRFLAFFSSVSGRFGNRGQADYAAANEVLNKLAAHLDAHWPARVVAVNWGPWDGSNMVGEAVRDQFVRRGVQLIEASSGCNALIEELVAGRKGEPEVILGGGPWGETPAAGPVEAAEFPLLEMEPLVPVAGGAVKLVIQLDPSRHRYLADHCLDAKPVLPAAMAIELMAETVKKGWPDRVVTGVKSVRVYKGIVVDESSRAVCVSVRPQTHHHAEDLDLAVDVDISDPDRPAVTYYRGTVCLADRLPGAPPAAPRFAAEFGSSPMSVADPYKHRLFHGPRFQCLKRIAALNELGVRAQVSPSRPADCMGAARGGSWGSWIIDPILLDSGPQLLILWAQAMRGMTALPSRFGEVRIFDGLAEALLAGASEPLECRLLVDAAGDGPIITASYRVFGPGGEVVLSVEGLESTGSESLNRLAVGAASAGS